jgi:hypothetical protein
LFGRKLRHGWSAAFAVVLCSIASGAAQAQTNDQVASAFADGVNLCRDLFTAPETQRSVADVIANSSFVAAPQAQYAAPFARIYTSRPGSHVLMQPKWPGEGEPILYAIFTVGERQPPECQVIALQTPGAERQALEHLDRAAEWKLETPEPPSVQGFTRRAYYQPLSGKRRLLLLLAYRPNPEGISAHAAITLMVDRR